MRDFERAVRARLAREALSPAREAEVLEELVQHMEDRYADLLGSGRSPADAEADVLREFAESDAGLSWVRSPADARGTGVTLGGGGDGAAGVFAGVRSDAAYAVRTLRTSGTFAIAAIMALGLGTGAATAVFSLLDGVVLRPLPFAAPEPLVTLTETNVAEGLREQRVSPVTFLDYRASGAFEDAAAWWVPETNLADDVGDPIRVATVETSENLFAVMGVGAQVGRTFPVDTTLHGDEPEVVISDRLWRTRFGGREDVIGRTVRLNGFPHPIVGVMPAGFHFPDDTDVWQRLSWDLHQHSRVARFMGAVGRLDEGVTVLAANGMVEQAGRRVAQEFPQTNAEWSGNVELLAHDVTGIFRPALYALFAASGLLLLIGCINVANLRLARASSREAELAVRGALGASRLRLVRQLLVESVLLAAAGGILGLAVAAAAVRAFLRWSPVDIPRSGDVAVDLRVLAFAIGVSLLTVLLFGLVPALRASRADVAGVLRSAARGAGAAQGRRGRGVLVLTEVALAVALLCGAALLVRTMAMLSAEDTGVTRLAPVVFDIQLPDAQYDFAAAGRFHTALLRDLRAHPRIETAAAANFLPLELAWRAPFVRVGAEPAAEPPMVQHLSVDEMWFDAVGANLLDGRMFDERDDTSRAGVVIINEALARRYFGNERAVGQRIALNMRTVGPMGRRLTVDDEHEIVGVVSDVRNVSLTEPAEPAIHYTARQFPFRRMYVVLDGPGSDAELLEAARGAVRALDPTLPLGAARSMAEVLAGSTGTARLLMTIMSAFAGLALVLALTGIYGVLSFMVDQRRREIGIRMALGATSRTVLAMVVRSALLLAGGGIAAGILIAVLFGRMLEAVLFRVEAADPLSFAAAGALVLAAVLVATLMPARRALATDPMRTLRE